MPSQRKKNLPLGVFLTKDISDICLHNASSPKMSSVSLYHAILPPEVFSTKDTPKTCLPNESGHCRVSEKNCHQESSRPKIPNKHTCPVHRVMSSASLYDARFPRYRLTGSAEFAKKKKNCHQGSSGTKTFFKHVCILHRVRK